MKIRPILFSAPMVLAILEGRKAQTRRVVKHNLQRLGDGDWYAFDHKGSNYRVNARHKTVGAWAHLLQFCPYGQPGDRLWVRETWRPIYAQDPAYNNGEPIEIDYKAGHSKESMQWRLMDDMGIRRWKPSIYMPRSASRITLDISGVRSERLQDISEADACAEGIIRHGVSDDTGLFHNYLDDTTGFIDARDSYQSLWESINGLGSWAANPWVWVIEFQVV